MGSIYIQFDVQLKEAEIEKIAETQKRNRLTFTIITILVGLLLVLIIVSSPHNADFFPSNLEKVFFAISCHQPAFQFLRLSCTAFVTLL
jgi:hypothetical protein